MSRVILKKNEERRIKQGHLWVFSNEIESIQGDLQNGELVEVTDSGGNYLVSGFYNVNSLISVRVISKEKDFELPKQLEKKLISAFDYRRSVYPNRNSFRMVFSESDFLPGLIIDKYNDTFVLQIYSAGMEANVGIIVDVLKEKLSAKNIFTKHDEYFRKLEGLPEQNSVYLGSAADEIISDGKVKYKINFETGQKTGFYFDQCDNREFVGRFCKDKTVLDCFCNSGGFGLHALKNDAAHVTFVDSSKEELENVKSNLLLNKITTEAEYSSEDVFDYLEKCIAAKKKFDIVNIDPPAFAKNKKTLSKAVKGYERLNKLAMEVVSDGGLLFSSSCSHHLKDEMFLDMIGKAVAKSDRNVQQIYFNNASLDHPLLPTMNETVYLKFVGLRIS